MAQELIDITGNTYNFLHVVGFSHIGERRRSYWNCQCLKCGKIVTARKDAFAYPYSRMKSCGCWHVEESKMRAKENKDRKSGKFVKA
jgi:hypothetical protein